MLHQRGEEEEEEFIRIHGYYSGTQGARCYTDGASLQPDESEGCSPVRGRTGPTTLRSDPIRSSVDTVAEFRKVEVVASVEVL